MSKQKAENYAFPCSLIRANEKTLLTAQDLERVMDARDMQINNRKLVESFYLSQMQDSAASGDGKLVFSGKEGSFYIDAALYRAQQDGLSGVIYYYGTEEKTAEEGAEAGEEAEE